MAWTIYTTLKGRITVRSGLEKEYGRKQIVFSQNPVYLPKRRNAPRRGKDRRVLTVQIGLDLFVYPFGT